jgi:hypothetical protein
VCFFDLHQIGTRFVGKDWIKFEISSDIFGREGVLFEEISVCAIEYDMSTKITCSRTNLDYPIRCLYKGIVMFDDHNRIAHLLEFSDCIDDFGDFFFV